MLGVGAVHRGGVAMWVQPRAVKNDLQHFAVPPMELYTFIMWLEVLVYLTIMYLISPGPHYSKFLSPALR
eukprot:5852575-Pyramimonas_sp.AAC.1